MQLKFSDVQSVFQRHRDVWKFNHPKNYKA
jgi:hypothetical protein